MFFLFALLYFFWGKAACGWDKSDRENEDDRDWITYKSQEMVCLLMVEKPGKKKTE